MYLRIRHNRCSGYAAGCLVREIKQEGAFIPSTVEGFQGCQIPNEYIDAEKIENTKLRKLIGVITQMLI